MKKDKPALLLLALAVLVGRASSVKKTETATKPPAPPPPPPEIIFIQFSPDVTSRPQLDDVINRGISSPPGDVYLRRRKPPTYEIEPYLGTLQTQQTNINQLTLNNPDFNVPASKPITTFQRPQGHTPSNYQGQRPQYQQPQGQRPPPQVQRPQYQQPQGQRPQYQQPQIQRPQYQQPQGQRPQYQQPQGQRPQYQQPQVQRPTQYPQRPSYNPPRRPFATVISSPLNRPRDGVLLFPS